MNPLVKYDTTTRFKDASWYDNNLEVMVGGVGGIGSWLSFLLGRQNIRLIIFDNDVVNNVNLGGQLYSNNYIDSTKVDSMKSIINDFSNNYRVVTHSELYTETSYSLPIMFSCFDNMQARKVFFNNWKESYLLYTTNGRPAIPMIYIDGRMSVEDFQIYTVKSEEDIDRYEKTLFDDSELEDARCSYKATSHCGAMIASMMVGLFNNYISNYKTGEQIREVPFSTSVSIPMMSYEFTT